jgi:hypothetical protein
MKKVMILLAIALLPALQLLSQDAKPKTDKPAFLILNGGVSLPIGDFASNDINNEQAGLAKTGFNLNLQGGYHFTKSIGVTAVGVYGSNGVDKSSLHNVPNVEAGDWGYWGVLVGPMYTYNISPKTMFDLSAMTGFMRAHTPSIGITNVSEVKEEKATAMPLRFDGSFRFRVGSNIQIFTGCNFMFVKPTFKPEGTKEYSQKMQTMNFNAGIGLGF